MSSRSPKSSLHPKMSLTGTQEPLSHSQEEGKAEAESPLSSEVLVSVSLVQNEPGELSATLDHLGDTLSKSLLNFPDISATTNILAQQLVVLAS